MLGAATAPGRGERNGRDVAETRDARSESPPPGFRGSKRRQVKKACAHCRKGHRCCEEQRPCKRCRGLPCDDGEPQKPRFKLYPTDPPPAATHIIRANPQPAAQPLYSMHDVHAFQLLMQQAQQQQRYASPMDGEMSLTDTVGMNFRGVPSLTDLRALPSSPPFSSTSPAMHWISTRPSVAIPTPVSLAASTEQHHNLVQSINSLRNSIPLEQLVPPSALVGRSASDALSRSAGLSHEPPLGFSAGQSIGMQQTDSALDVLRNSFFSLGEPKAEQPQGQTSQSLLQQSQTAAQLARLQNPLLHTAAFLPPPAPLHGNPRITSLTTSAPPTFFAPPPLRTFVPVSPPEHPLAASALATISAAPKNIGTDDAVNPASAALATSSAAKIGTVSPASAVGPTVASSANAAGPLVDSASL